MKVPLIKGDSVDSSVDFRDALPVNMYGVSRDVLGSSGYMINWYGLTEFSTGNGVDRGAAWVSAEGIQGHYRISGQSLIRISSDSGAENLGEILGDGQASIAYSFNNVAIVSGGNLYYYNPTDGLRQITDEDLGNPIDIVWVDGYFFLTDGKDIYHSNIADENQFEPLDFGNSQFLPDPSRGLGKNEDNEILVFGEFSTEYFVNVGSENFAFRRIQAKAQKIGILGTHCKREMAGKWYTIARRKESAPRFHIISLGNEQAISSREVDKVLSTYTPDELNTSTVDTMVIDGVSMVVYHLPNHVFMFNETVASKVGVNNAWTILKSDVNGDTPYRAKDPILDPNIGKWIVGDKYNQKIGYMNPDIFTQYDELVEWTLFTPFVKLESLSVNKLEIDTIPGITIEDDARVFISQTVNGRSYSNEWSQLYGDQFDYNQRFYIRALGYCRNWVGYKLRSASRSRMAFTSIDIEAS